MYWWAWLDSEWVWSTYQRHGRDVVSHVVDGQDSGDDHLGLGGNEGGKHESRAIAEQQLTRDVESLEVFCATWCGRNWNLQREGERERGREGEREGESYLLFLAENIDGAALSDIWVSN